jgi:hypothetical protein
MVTALALVAVTVRVDGPPEATVVGFAVMPTVGVPATVTVAAAVVFPPVPVAVAV